MVFSIRQNVKVLSLTMLAMAALTASLTGCSGTTAPAESPSATASKEAGIFTKDLAVCIVNGSSETVDLSWVSGLSTNDGSGALASGDQMCGEGPDPRMKLTFSDGFGTFVDAYNPAIGQPMVWFSSLEQKEKLDCSPGQDGCHQVITGDIYSEQSYAQGQTSVAEFGGHSAKVSRSADNDWINFQITITD